MPGLPDRSPLRAIPARGSGIPFYIMNGGRPLAAHLHQGPNAHPQRTPIVICTGLGYEGLFLHPSVRLLAEYLSTAGHRVLRFDYDTTMDSGGSDRDPDRVARWMASIGSAINCARDRTGFEQVTLLGLRLGASMAAMVAATRSDVSQIIAWAPCSGRQFVKHMRAFGKLVHKTATRGPAAGSPPDGLEANGFFFSDATLTGLEEVRLPDGQPTRRFRRALLLKDPSQFGQPVDAALLATLADDFTEADVRGFDEMLLPPSVAQTPIEAFATIRRWLEAEPATAPEHAASRDEVTVVAEVEPGVREEMVWCDEGKTIFGVLTTPTSKQPSRGLVLLNNAAGHHVGPHAMWTQIARHLALDGIAVLRADLHGLGDSSLPADVAPYHDYSLDRIPDVAALVGFMGQRGISDVAVGGLCSGAHLAYHFAAQARPRQLKQVILINPQTFSWSEGDSLDVSPLDDAYAAEYYRSSLASPDKWLKLLRGQTNLTHALGVVRRRIVYVVAAAWNRLRSHVPLGPQTAVAMQFGQLLGAGVGITCVLSGGDPSGAMLDDKLGYSQSVFARRYALRRFVVPGADHSFTPAWATDALEDLLLRAMAWD